MELGLLCTYLLYDDLNEAYLMTKLKKEFFKAPWDHYKLHEKYFFSQTSHQLFDKCFFLPKIMGKKFTFYAPDGFLRILSVSLKFSHACLVCSGGLSAHTKYGSVRWM